MPYVCMFILIAVLYVTQVQVFTVVTTQHLVACLHFSIEPH